MNWFKNIQMFYPKFWDKSMVADAVIIGKLTEDEYEQIVGEKYVADTE